jgi:hypothetical protein
MLPLDRISHTPWQPFNDGHTLDHRGSEQGIIMRDEEHIDGARITLERDGITAPFSITCGVYDWLVHTCFFSTEEAAQQAFEKMKAELDDILLLIRNQKSSDAEITVQDIKTALAAFVKRFP